MISLNQNRLEALFSHEVLIVNRKPKTWRYSVLSTS